MRSPPFMRCRLLEFILTAVLFLPTNSCLFLTLFLVVPSSYNYSLYSCVVFVVLLSNFAALLGAVFTTSRATKASFYLFYLYPAFTAPLVYHFYSSLCVSSLVCFLQYVCCILFLCNSPCACTQVFGYCWARKSTMD